LFLPRWLRPVRREPGKLVGHPPRRSSNLLLGVFLYYRVMDEITSK
jgi:hypothetical protein